jgi:hypothetical protein
MKQIIASLSISACLLLPSAGVVFATDPHNPVTGTGTTGQPGSINGISCNTGAVGAGPGGSVSANGSPFNTSVTKGYAGGPGPNPTNPVGGHANVITHAVDHAVSEYDVACFQHSVH